VTLIENNMTELPEVCLSCTQLRPEQWRNCMDEIWNEVKKTRGTKHKSENVGIIDVEMQTI
jgi:hypothetical protein